MIVSTRLRRGKGTDVSHPREHHGDRLDYGSFLSAHPDAVNQLRAKAALMRAMRTFLDDRGGCEVPVPVLQQYREGAPIHQYATTHPVTGRQFYLRHGMHDYLRRLAAAVGPVYTTEGHSLHDGTLLWSLPLTGPGAGATPDALTTPLPLVSAGEWVWLLDHAASTADAQTVGHLVHASTGRQMTIPGVFHHTPSDLLLTRTGHTVEGRSLA